METKIKVREDDIAFTKTSLPYGWMGNFSRHPVVYNGQKWPTTEHLFQALRFFEPGEGFRVVEKIRLAKSPFEAKQISRNNSHLSCVKPKSVKDLINMSLVITLKLENHPELIKLLLETANRNIYEDVSNRPKGNNLFWGARQEKGFWYGRNVLGRLWMRERAIRKRNESHVGTQT